MGTPFPSLALLVVLGLCDWRAGLAAAGLACCLRLVPPRQRAAGSERLETGASAAP